MQSPRILYLLEIVSKKYYYGYAKVLKYFIVLETVKKKEITTIIYIYKMHTNAHRIIIFHLVKIMSKKYFSSYANL